MDDKYISKEKALNLIEHNDKVYHYADKQYEDIVYATTQKICEVVAEIPSADVQPVLRGKWESSQRTIETGTVYCSNCAIEYYISDLQTVGDCNGIVHYCPNCGVRMNEG